MTFAAIATKIGGDETFSATDAMHEWNWKPWNGQAFLTCSLLEPFAHGFFTQQFAPATPEALVEALAPNADVFRVKQVHGNAVVTPTDVRQHLPVDEADSSFPHADGLVSEAEQQAIWVCTADCVPGLVADVKTGAVAAVHAGWRGTAQKILPLAIARLQAQGSQLSDLRVALGPAIAGDAYQVSTTVAAEVGATVVPDALEDTAPEALLDVLRSWPASPVLDDPQPGRARLDVRRVNVLQLEQLGFQPEQVAIAPYCTYRHADRFFSYRRDRLKKVQWSGIVSQSPEVRVAS